MRTTIYFLRHGEVENPKKILYGRLPGFSLSEAGRKRIEEVARGLADKKIDYIYSSPMKRTRETTQIVNRVLGKPVKISRLLIETDDIHAGIALEVFKRDIQPHLYDDRFVKHGQESIQSQAERMTRFVKMMQEKHSGKTILAVSHGDPIMILKAKILGVPFTWEFKRSVYLQQGNYISVICENGSYKVE